MKTKLLFYLGIFLLEAHEAFALFDVCLCKSLYVLPGSLYVVAWFFVCCSMVLCML